MILYYSDSNSVDDVIPKSADATIASIIDEKCNEWRQVDRLSIVLLLNLWIYSCADISALYVLVG